MPITCITLHTPYVIPTANPLAEISCQLSMILWLLLNLLYVQKKGKTTKTLSKSFFYCVVFTLVKKCLLPVPLYVPPPHSPLTHLPPTHPFLKMPIVLATLRTPQSPPTPPPPTFFKKCLLPVPLYVPPPHPTPFLRHPYCCLTLHTSLRHPHR
jgi:hypothetical protein